MRCVCLQSPGTCYKVRLSRARASASRTVRHTRLHYFHCKVLLPHVKKPGYPRKDGSLPRSTVCPTKCHSPGPFCCHLFPSALFPLLSASFKAKDELQSIHRCYDAADESRPHDGAAAADPAAFRRLPLIKLRRWVVFSEQLHLRSLKQVGKVTTALIRR